MAESAVIGKEMKYELVVVQGDTYLRGTSYRHRNKPVWADVWLRNESEEILRKAKREIDRLLDYHFGVPHG